MVKVLKSTDASFINSKVTFVHEQTPIAEAVKIMVEKTISSILVNNDAGQVVGIITERDIVRKFTLLDMSDKLEKNVSTFMTRPVQFVGIENLEAQIIKIHQEKRFRHFPVLNGKEPKIENIVGIVSITDLLKRYIQGGSLEVPSTPLETRSFVYLLCNSQNMFRDYEKVLKTFGCTAYYLDDRSKFFSPTNESKPPLIFDMDGYDEATLRDLVPITRKYKGLLIMSTSNPSILSLFRRSKSSTSQHIALKPLDFSYILWLLGKAS